MSVIYGQSLVAASEQLPLAVQVHFTSLRQIDQEIGDLIARLKAHATDAAGAPPASDSRQQALRRSKESLKSLVSLQEAKKSLGKEIHRLVELDVEKLDELQRAYQTGAYIQAEADLRAREEARDQMDRIREREEEGRDRGRGRPHLLVGNDKGNGHVDRPSSSARADSRAGRAASGGGGGGGGGGRRPGRPPNPNSAHSRYRNTGGGAGAGGAGGAGGNAAGSDSRYQPSHTTNQGGGINNSSSNNNGRGSAEPERSRSTGPKRRAAAAATVANAHVLANDEINPFEIRSDSAQNVEDGYADDGDDGTDVPMDEVDPSIDLDERGSSARKRKKGAAGAGGERGGAVGGSRGGDRGGRTSATKRGSTPKQKKYCVPGCKLDETDMVACDNPDCEGEWFHYPCVGLKGEPASKKWYCPKCTEQRAAAKQQHRQTAAAIQPQAQSQTQPIAVPVAALQSQPPQPPA